MIRVYVYNSVRLRSCAHTQPTADLPARAIVYVPKETKPKKEKKKEVHSISLRLTQPAGQPADQPQTS